MNDVLYDDVAPAPVDYTPEEMEAIFGYLTDDNPPPEHQLVQIVLPARRAWRGGWQVQIGGQELFIPDFAARTWRPAWAGSERGVEMHRLAQSLAANADETAVEELDR